MFVRLPLAIVCCALAISSGMSRARADRTASDSARAEQRRPKAAGVDQPAERELERGDEARADDLQFGALVGVGFPRPLAVEGMVKVQRAVSIGVEYSLLPATTISGVSTSFWAVAADLRLFPFRNGFFLGLRIGRQYVAADATLLVSDQRLPVAASMQTTFLNPRAGILWTWSSGVTLGIDAGLQIPVSSRMGGVLAYGDDVALPQGMEIVSQVRSVAGYLGESTIPTLDLVRIGLLL